MGNDKKWLSDFPEIRYGQPNGQALAEIRHKVKKVNRVPHLGLCEDGKILKGYGNGCEISTAC